MVSLPLQFDKACAESWSLEEVVERWLQLYKGDKLIYKYEYCRQFWMEVSIEAK